MMPAVRNRTRSPPPPAARAPRARGRPQRYGYALGLILAAGGLARIVYLAADWRANPFAPHPIEDAQTYWQWAERIAGGQLVASTPFFSAPLYPYLLAVVCALGGGLAAVYGVQVAMHLATAALIAGAVAQRAAPAAGLIAAGIFLLLTDAAYFTGRILSCTLQGLLVALLWRQLLAARQRPGLLAGAAAGLLAGLNCLATPPMLAALPVVVAWVALQCHAVRRGLLCGMTALAASLAAIAPATIHNYLACGEFIPVSAQAGITFCHGNAPSAFGIYTPVEGIARYQEVQNLDVLRRFQEETGRAASWRAAGRHFFSKGLQYWQEDWVRAMRLMLTKAYWFLSARNYGDIYYPREELRHGLARGLWLAPVPVAWLSLPAIVAFAGLCRRPLRNLPELMLVLIPFLTVIFFYYSPRYRFPAVPVLAGLAALAVSRAWSWRTTPQWTVPTVLATAGGVALGPINAAIEFDAAVDCRAHFYQCAGSVWAQQGDPQTAIRYLEGALEISPADAGASAVLAAVLIQYNQAQRALSVLRRALEQHPKEAMLYDQLAWAYMQLQRQEEALASFRTAADLSPSDLRIRNSLAAALITMGRYSEAEAHVREALRLRPDSPLSLLNLAQICLHRQELDLAEAYCQRVLRAAPDLVDALIVATDIDVARGRPRAAIQALQRAVRLAPTDLEAARRLAWRLATLPGLTRQERAAAVDVARRVVQGMPDNPFALDALAAAHAARQEFREAVATAGRALSLAEELGLEALSSEIRARIALYGSGRPYLDPEPGHSSSAQDEGP